MTAFERRVIKSQLVDTLEAMGFSVSATDSASIIVFTDKPVTRGSFRYCRLPVEEPYMTSFGPVAALNFIEANHN